MLKKAPVERPALQRQIGPVALLFTGITGIIGSGWLFASLYAAQLAGPAAILSWLIGGGVARCCRSSTPSSAACCRSPAPSPAFRIFRTAP
jgi:amino acid transporter